ncbi:hypothetical protein OG900_33590 [Streptomyces sp. NBC_00433]
MWNSKRNQILDLKARLAVAQRAREGSLSAEDAAALTTELRTTRMRLTHANEQITDQAKTIMQLVRGISREQPATDPCAHGCRDAVDQHTRLSQEIAAGEVAP